MMKVRIGLIGLSHPHSLAHLRTFAYLEEVEAVVVCDASAAAIARARADCAKVTAAHDNPEALLADASLPVVALALPNNESVAMVARAAATGKHVLCEKPCARTAAEFAVAIDSLAAADRLFCVYYVWRANPAIVEMRRLVRAGAIGRLTSVELRMVTTQVGLRDPRHWLFRHDVAGGGILSWLGCHWLDLLRFVSGEEVVSVSAMLGTVSGENIDVEDVAGVTLRLSGGAVASLHAGYLLPQGRAGFENPGYDMGLVFRGTAGTIAHSGFGSEQTLTLESVAPAWEANPRQVLRYTLPQAAAYGGAHGAEFVRRFLDAALAGEGGSPASANDALAVLRLLDGIYASAAGECTVHLSAL